MTAEAVRLRVRNPVFDAAVVERLVAALAARIDLPIDRLQDARLLAATVVELARDRAADGHLDAVMTADGGRIDLRVGPLEQGGAHSLIDAADVPSVGNLVTLLGGGWEAIDDGGNELLRVTLASAAGGGEPAA